MEKKSIYIGLITVMIIVVGGLVFFKFTNKKSQINHNQVSNQFSLPSAISNNDLLETFGSTSTEILNNQQLEQNSAQPQEKLYTLEEVAQHNSKESCWTVIRDRVYDLTQWIDKHPGGSDKISALCGKDGTQAFENKHGGEEKPEKALEQFEIGKLKQ